MLLIIKKLKEETRLLIGRGGLSSHLLYPKELTQLFLLRQVLVLKMLYIHTPFLLFVACPLFSWIPLTMGRLMSAWSIPGLPQWPAYTCYPRSTSNSRLSLILFPNRIHPLLSLSLMTLSNNGSYCRNVWEHLMMREPERLNLKEEQLLGVIDAVTEELSGPDHSWSNSGVLLSTDTEVWSVKGLFLGPRRTQDSRFTSVSQNRKTKINQKLLQFIRSMHLFIHFPLSLNKEAKPRTFEPSPSWVSRKWLTQKPQMLSEALELEMVMNS